MKPRRFALGTDAKLRVLEDLLERHYPEPILIFTNDNATVYRISQNLLIPAITHQTPVKERHDVLSRFRNGDYRTLVASHVLNEGVDVPEARVAILLSGSGSNREYIQRLGRVLRRGNDPGKQAILYEVISEDTSEERTSKRRRGQSPDRNAKPRPRPLRVVSKPDDPIPFYDRPSRRSQPRAAEEGSSYNSDEEE